MNAEQTVDWLPAVYVLAIGLVAGGVLAWRALAAARRARPGKQSALAVQVRDLDGKRDVLLRQLHELDDAAGKRTAVQLAQERYALELEAARALLLLDQAGVEPRREGEPARPAAQPAVRGFLWGTASTAAVLLLGFSVYLSAKPRETGGSVTGNLPARAGAPEDQAQLAEIKSAIERNPEDLEARLALAAIGVERREYMSVWNETSKVLEREPGNARALAYQAVVRIAMGQAPAALEMLRRSIAADPTVVEARVYLAMAYERMGRMPEARKAIADASREFPDRAADLSRVLSDLQSQTPPAQAAAASAGEDPHARIPIPKSAAGGGPTSKPAAGGAAPEGGGRRVAGVIELAPALRSTATPQGVLFVFARNAHATSGPPIAVKRMPAIFPARFELGQRDSMMGQEFPERVLIEARLDADGDPTTRDPADPRARLDDVKAGRTDLRLVLSRP